MVVAGVTVTSNHLMLAFGVRTIRANATLVYQSSRVTTYRRRIRESDGAGFITVYLYGGFVVVHLGTDARERTKVVTLRSTRTFNDGQLHTVMLMRHEDSVTLVVDDVVEKQTTFGERDTIGSQRSQLFLGGFPSGVSVPTDEMPAQAAVPLRGCISDLLVNYRRVPLVPEQMQHVALGVCRLQGVRQPEGPIGESNADSQ